MEVERERIIMESKKWNIIYPAYLNSKYTIEQGRRVPKNKGCEDPTLKEISEVLNYFKIPHVVELDKAYPRDWINPGRIRIKLKSDDKTLTNPEIKNKRQLLFKLGELIPKLKSRVNPESEDANKQAGGKKKKKR